MDYVVAQIHAPLFYYLSTINDIMVVTLDRDVVFNGEVWWGLVGCGGCGEVGCSGVWGVWSGVV